MNNKLLGIAIIGGLLLTGCVFAPGGDGRDYDRGPRVDQPTMGQELLDLDRALDAGVINQQEFDSAKARILAGRDRN